MLSSKRKKHQPNPNNNNPNNNNFNLNNNNNQQPQPQPQSEIKTYFDNNFNKIFDSYQNIEELKNFLNNSNNEYKSKKEFIKLLIDKITENINIPKKLNIFNLFYNFVIYKEPLISQDLKNDYDKIIKNIIFNYNDINSYFIFISVNENESIKFDIYIREVLIYYFNIKELELKLFEIFYSLFNILNIINNLNLTKLIYNFKNKILFYTKNKIFKEVLYKKKLTNNQMAIEDMYINQHYSDLDFTTYIQAILSIESYCILYMKFLKNMYDVFNDIILEKKENNNDAIQQILNNLVLTDDNIDIRTLNDNNKIKNLEVISLKIKEKIKKYDKDKYLTNKEKSDRKSELILYNLNNKKRAANFNAYYKKNTKKKKSRLYFKNNTKYIQNQQNKINTIARQSGKLGFISNVNKKIKTYRVFNSSNIPQKIIHPHETEPYNQQKIEQLREQMKQKLQIQPKSILKKKPGFFGRLFGRFTQNKKKTN